MKNKFIFIISLLFVAFLHISNVNATNENEVTFNIGVDKVYNGIKFPVYVNINNKQENISGILFDLEYDPNKLEALIDDNDYNTQVVGNNSVSSILSTNDKDIVYAYNNDNGSLTYYSSLKNEEDNNIVIWFRPKQFTSQELKINVSDFSLYEGNSSNISDNYTVNYNLNVNSGLGISDVSINNKINKLYIGYKYRLNSSIYPNDTELSKNIEWSSSNPSVASIDDYGLVSAHNPGKVVLTAKASNGVIDTDTILITLGKMTFNSVTNIKEGIRLNWNSNSEVDGFNIYRKVGKGKYKRIARVKGNVSQFIDTKVENGYFYTYAIRSFDKYEESPYKAVSIYKINRPGITKLSNKKSKTVKVEYKKNKIVDGYQIIYSTDSTFKTNVNKVKVGYKYISESIKKLKKNKIYYFKVRSYSKYKGVKYWSAWSSVKYIKVKK